MSIMKADNTLLCRCGSRYVAHEIKHERKARTAMKKANVLFLSIPKFRSILV